MSISASAVTRMGLGGAMWVPLHTTFPAKDAVIGPTARVITVLAERQTATAQAEGQTATVLAEGQTATVQAERQTITVLSRTGKTLTVYR